MNLTAQEAALAWAQGKKVEAMRTTPGTWEWASVCKPGEERKVGQFFASVFSDGEHTFRLAPEPKLRPWKMEEVPLGAWYLYETGFPAQFADRLFPAGVRFAGEISPLTSYEFLAEKYRHSIDGGKTWLPCGVMEGGAL